MAAAGIRWIQVRAKHMRDRDLFDQVERSCAAAQRYGADIWVDDRADLAAMLPVSGVHLGQQDLPPRAARSVMGEGVWIGRSTHNEEQFLEAQEDPHVDVVALGPVFLTTSKERPDPVVGLGLLQRLAERATKPLVAIGGIDAANVADVLAAGADSAVVLSAVCVGDVTMNSRRLLAVGDG